MASVEPRVRAKHLQRWVALARSSMPADKSQRFLSAIDPEVLTAIEKTLGSTWLPMRMDVLLADVMHQTLGVSECHRFYIRLSLDACGGPILGPMLSAALRVAGTDPSQIARWWPKGWPGLFENCGALSGEVLSARSARLYYRDLPDFCVQSGPWVDSIQSSVYGAFVFLGAQGVARTEADIDKRSVTVHLEW